MRDFDGVYGLLKQLWPDKRMNKDRMREVFTGAIESGDNFCFCAEVGSLVVGFCALYVLHIRNRFWREVSLGFVGELIVDRPFRRRGIGKALLEAAADRSREAGCRVLEQDSALGRDGAHEFYEKVGFRKRAYLFSRDL